MRNILIPAVVIAAMVVSPVGWSKFDTATSQQFWKGVMQEREEARANFALWRERDTEWRAQIENMILTKLGEQRRNSEIWWTKLKEDEQKQDRSFRERKTSWEQDSISQRDKFHREFEMRVRGYDEKGMSYPYPYPWD